MIFERNFDKGKGWIVMEYVSRFLIFYRKMGFYISLRLNRN